MSTPAWPKNLEPKPTYTLCTRCGISTHPDTRPRMCRDCVGAERARGPVLAADAIVPALAQAWGWTPEQVAERLQRALREDVNA